MAKRRIGILTFHRADNIGAVLQSYALQRTLEERCNADVHIIDYVCPSVEDVKYKRGLKGLALKAYYWIKHRNFERFRKAHLHLSERYTEKTIANMSEWYDAVIVGSDQVWNYECTGWDDAYFLNFLPEETKKYSYAASLGKYRFSEQEKPRVRMLLDSFDGISVREETAREHLADVTNQIVDVCPDPVMLLNWEQWQMVMSGRMIREKYVFVYLVLPDVHVMKAAEEYAQKNGCRLISNKKNMGFILNGSPSDFLSWVFHAERVFTNSFHGTAFSLLFGKSLGVETELKDGSPNERVLEVLVKSGVGDECILCGNGECGSDAQAVEAIGKMARIGCTYLERICR